MSQRKLKLIKRKKEQTGPQRRLPETKPAIAQSRRPKARIAKRQSPALTPAEAAEVARFKALTAARAARQAMIRQIMAELQETETRPPAA